MWGGAGHAALDERSSGWLRCSLDDRVLSARRSLRGAAPPVDDQLAWFGCSTQRLSTALPPSAMRFTPPPDLIAGMRSRQRRRTGRLAAPRRTKLIAYRLLAAPTQRPAVARTRRRTVSASQQGSGRCKAGSSPLFWPSGTKPLRHGRAPADVVRGRRIIVRVEATSALRGLAKSGRRRYVVFGASSADRRQAAAPAMPAGSSSCSGDQGCRWRPARP